MTGSEAGRAAFEEYWRTSGLTRLEDGIDLGATITDSRYPSAAPTELDVDRTPLAEAVAGLPLIAIDLGRQAAEKTWALPWAVAQRLREEAAGAAGADLEAAVLLGEGGMGVVTLAHQRSLDREVAVKSLKEEAGDPGAAGALLHEGRILGALDHPNVVPIHALGRDELGRPVLVVKRVEGVSWKTLIADGDHAFWNALPAVHDDRLVRHLEILMEVTNAVDFAHSRGVLHRDLKPENVMIGSYGEVYVLDWGIAVRLGPAPESRPFDALAETRPGTRIVGTPVYMAPEMLSGDPVHLDWRTDVFLLGAILHQILTGHPPHSGQSLHGVLISVCLGEPRDYPEDAPAPLVDLCRRALDRDPAGRPPGAAAFREEIAAYLRHRGAIELTAAADDRRGELERRLGAEIGLETESHLVHQIFAECQFGYMQALREWPENPGAREGLERALEAMARHEIRRRQLDAAEGHVGRMSSPPTELVEALRALRASLLTEADEQAALRRMRHELDFQVATGARLRYLLLAVGVAFVVFFSRVLPSASQSAPDDYGYALTTDVLATCVLAALLFWRRRQLLGTRINRLFFGLIFLGMAHTVGQRALCWYLGVGLRESMILDTFVFAVLCAVGALTIRSWFAWGVVAGGLGVGSMILWPARYQALYPLSKFAILVLFLVYMGFFLARREEP